jgi:hypothetical protein
MTILECVCLRFSFLGFHDCLAFQVLWHYICHSLWHRQRRLVPGRNKSAYHPCSFSTAPTKRFQFIFSVEVPPQSWDSWERGKGSWEELIFWLFIVSSTGIQSQSFSHHRVLVLGIIIDRATWGMDQSCRLGRSLPNWQVGIASCIPTPQWCSRCNSAEIDGPSSVARRWFGNHNNH